MLFGFLTVAKNISFDDVEIKPLENHKHIMNKFHKTATVSKGYIYPPLQPLDKTSTEETSFSSDTYINSNFHTLESTHCLTTLDNDEDRERYLILAYGFLHGVYLSPDNNLYIKKVPYEIGKLTGVLPVGKDLIEGMKAFNSYYKGTSEKQHNLLFSIIHWFLIGQCYEYFWDRFTAQYLVLDTIYKLLEKLIKAHFNRQRNIPHAERPELLAKYYSLGVPDWAKYDSSVKRCKLSILRNELFHEAKIAGKPIGYAYPAENYDLEFVTFNLQLIISILGLNSNILTSSVKERGMNAWDFQLTSDFSQTHAQ